MEKGCYIVSANTNTPHDIVFSIKPDIEQVTENQQKLHIDIEKTLVVVRKLFENSQIELQHYFNQLLSLAQAGLVPDNAQPTISFNALAQLKLEIIDKKSGEIKNSYFKKLGFKAINLGILPLIVALGFKSYYHFQTDDELLESLNTFTNFLLVWSSCLFGIWLSFGTRKTILSFEELTTIEQDRLEPYLKLIFISSIALVFSLLFYKKVIILQFGSISTTEIESDPFVSIIFGIFLGLAENFIGSKLTKKVSALFESI
ncbi:hypothetical protein [Chryseobacterium sp. FH1]|uniref:hypothetical protein n=1 Tax=Chryseobacterium sp. FH1 TaxID=1233951 RepID=UPI000AEB96DB|nr:hypothetical protein [Chryseobacterium sp. FH1]